MAISEKQEATETLEVKLQIEGQIHIFSYIHIYEKC